MNMKNINNTKVGTYFYGDEALNFNFVTSLSASEKITFVNSVVNTIVDDNYNSIIRDIAFDYVVIRVFTDIDTTPLQNSEDMIDAIEQFLNETTVIDIVKANMEFGLLEQLNNAVDKAIEFRTGIHPSPIADALSSLLSTLERKVEEIDLGSAMSMAQKFAGMTDEFNLDNLVNAYMNSDIHQKNLDEIDESKKQKVEIAENLDKAIKVVSGSKKADGKKSSKSKK